MARRPAAVLTLCVVLLAPACSAESGDELRVATSSPPPVASSSHSSATASPGGVLAFAGGDVPLVPGTYTNQGFRPAFTFVLDSGWRGGHEVPNEFFDVIASDVTVAFARPVFVTGARDERIDVAGMDPTRVIETLAENPDLRATPRPAIRIDGHSAPTLELAPRSDVEVFGGSGGEFGAGAGQRHRISAVELDGTLMLVLAIAPGRPFEPAFTRAEKVISTIEA